MTAYLLGILGGAAAVALLWWTEREAQRDAQREVAARVERVRAEYNRGD